MRLVLAMLAVVALTGCATIHEPTDWKKPAATMQQLTADDVECERVARDAGHTPDLIVGGVVDVVRLAIEAGQRENSYRSCMRSHGYERKA
jgi:uncharacterized protein YceK